MHVQKARGTYDTVAGLVEQLSSFDIVCLSIAIVVYGLHGQGVD